jgi:site-specific DNA-methyltransferase (adenine-specific)
VLAGFPDTGASTVRITNGRPGLRGNHIDTQSTGGVEDNGGSAARFFYSSKAGPLDRLGSAHPTVKPVDLMRWLCRLITPPGGRILEPFAGSGKTGIAAMAEGFDCQMIDIEAEHVADIERQLAYLRGEGGTKFAEHNHAKSKRTVEAPLGGLFA